MGSKRRQLRPMASRAGGGGSAALVCWAVAAPTFLVVLAVYKVTSFPSVTGGDAGELVSEACQLGTAHPPGYPLFTMLAHAAIQLTSGTSSSPAQAVNLLSAGCGAGAASVLASTVFASTAAHVRPLAAVLGSLTTAALFAFLPLTWEYSHGAEVFALNNLLLSTLLLLAAHLAAVPAGQRDGSRLWLHLGAFVSGLCLTNQHSSLLFVVPLVLHAVWWRRRELLRRRWAPWATLTAAFLLGLSPFLYLIWAGRRATPGSWGDLTTLVGFGRHVLRTEYGTLRMLRGNGPSETMAERILLYLQHTSEESQHTLLPLGLAGMLGTTVCPVGPSKDSRRLPLALLTTWAFYLVVWNGVISNLNLSSPMAFEVHARFWMQPNLILALFAGFNVATLLDMAFAAAAPPRTTTSPPAPPAKGSGGYEHQISPPGWIAATLVRAVAVAVTALLWGRLLSASPRARNHNSGPGMTMHDYGSALLQSLPPQAFLLSHTDLDWNTVRYLRTCQAQRPDVTHLSLQLVPYPWFRRQHQLFPNVTFPPMFPGVSTDRLHEGNARLVELMVQSNWAHFGQYGVFLDMQSINDAEIGVSGAWRGGVRLLPWGLVYRVVPLAATQGSIGEWAMKSLEQLDLLKTRLQPAPVDRYKRGTWEFAASSVYWDAHNQLGLFFLTHAIELSATLSQDTLANYTQTLGHALSLLEPTLKHVTHTGQLSSSSVDLLKNTALAHLRMQAAVQVVLKSGKVLQQLKRPLQQQVAREGHEWFITRRAMEVLAHFVAENPDDKDVSVFRDALVRMEKQTQDPPPLAAAGTAVPPTTSTIEAPKSRTAATATPVKRKKRKKATRVGASEL